ncbi:MAG TPA: S8 family serine peptidase, partial [Xanthomonadales bacterium]|nr:S8 family serine peptidase [Xanthomonadales bacterium]
MNLNASKWGLRIGGNDGIDLPSSGLVLASGIAAFNSALDPAPGYELRSDDSTSVSLAGEGVVPSDGNIAGDDVAYVAMFWEVQPVATASDLFLLEVDASEGVYAPGNNLQVKLKIQNFGSDYSAVTNVSLYLSTDNAIGLGDSLVGTAPIPSLNVFETYEAVVSGPIPAVLDGLYVVGAVINYADTNLANNTNFDLHEITVSTAPEIQVQPLALDFDEQSASAVEHEELQQSVDQVAVASTAVFSGLVERARKDGKVRVIVGYESAFHPEGMMSESQAQAQRQRISDRADQVLDLIRGTPAQEYRRFDFIPFLALSVDEAALQALANSPLVTSIEEDTLSSPYLSSSSSVIGSPSAWAEGADGAGVAVAVLDTGIDKNHSWFSTGGNRVVSEACYSTSGPTDIGTSSSFCPGGVASSTAVNSGLNCDLGIAGCDHGTHVGGIVAGNDSSGPDFGVARSANLVAIQVFSLINDFFICFAPEPCIRSYKS